MKWTSQRSKKKRNERACFLVEYRRIRNKARGLSMQKIPRVIIERAGVTQVQQYKESIAELVRVSSLSVSIQVI